jgi:hypothetical protein
LVKGLVYLYREGWMASMVRWGVFFSALFYFLKIFPVFLAVIWSPIAVFLLLYGFHEVISGFKIHLS